MSFANFIANFIAEQRRLLILQALNEAAVGERVSLALLHRYCISIDLKPTADQVDSDLRHLADLQLLERTEKDGVVLALITQRGRDVASGRTRAPGVADQVVR